MNTRPAPGILALVCAGALACTLPARAAPPEATLTAALQDKASVGQARLKVWGFDVYDATLYARPGFDAARFGEQRFALELAYLRNFDGADIAERSIEEMERAGPLAPQQSQRWLVFMSRAFPNVTDGTRLSALHRPGEAVRFFVDGSPGREIHDGAFAERFFGIWLGVHTSQPAHRRQLLGSAP